MMNTAYRYSVAPNYVRQTGLPFYAVVTVNDIARISLPFFLITIGGSLHFANTGLQNTLEAVGYIIIILTVSFMALRKNACSSGDWGIAICVFILLAPSLFLEELENYRRLSFLLSAAVLISISIISKGQISKQHEIMLAISGVAVGLIVSFVLAVLDNYSVGSIGNFDGGILFKNYFAGDMLCLFIGVICVAVQKKRWTIGLSCVACVSAVMVLVSGSKGALLLLGIFLTCVLLGRFYAYNTSHERFVIVLLCVGAAVAILMLFIYVVADIETYQYRVRGFQNYLSYIKGDAWHTLIGNAGLLYSGQTNYAQYFRELTGWDGSIEFAWLNVLIKNGVLGIVAYIAIFIRLLKLVNAVNTPARQLAFALIVVLFASTLVESYIETLHSVVGPFLFMLVSGMLVAPKETYNQGLANGFA